MTDSSQKFIARNRAPRVQIEYDVELYGSQKTVQLPFVMGVMSDLAGKSRVAQPAVADRSFLEIDVDNFDDRMRAMAPRTAFSVPNTLTGEGNLNVDLTFEKMEDFSPAAIAAKVDSLRPLLEARTQLSNLMAYMDGKAGAEALIEKILNDPGLLSAVSAAGEGADDQAAALESLRALTPADTPKPDETADVLAGLSANAPSDQPETDATDSVLSGLSAAAPKEVEPDTSSDDTLSALAARMPQDSEVPDDTTAALDSLADIEVPHAQKDTTDALLSDLAAAAPESIEEPDTTSDVLDGLAGVEVPEVEDDSTDDLLADLADAAPEPVEDVDITSDVLGGLADVEVPRVEEDTTDGLLADLAASTPEPVEALDTTSDVLDGLVDSAVPELEEDSVDDLLADLAIAPDAELETDSTADALDSLAGIDLPEAEQDSTDDLLAELASSAPTLVEEPDAALDALGTLVDVETPDPADESLDDLLGDLDRIDPVEDVAADVLDGLTGDMPTDVDDNSIDDLLGDIEQADDPDLDALLNDPDAGDDALDSLLGDGDAGDSALDDLLGDTDETSGDALSDDLSDLLADVTSDAGDDLDSLLGDPAPEDKADPGALPDDAGGDDLDSLLGDSTDDDLDALMGDLDGDSDLDALLGDLADDDSDLDGLLDDLDIEVDAPEEPIADTDGQVATMSDDPEFAYGQMSAERPEPAQLNRKRFRLAILGDFSGRSARGVLEIGDALAARQPILLDPDTAEDVIEGFATDLVLPIGKDGAGVAVKLGGLDDLHPDELYENVALFSELVGLRGQLSSGATAENAARKLREWGEKHGKPVAPTKARSSGNAVPADIKLSDFQKLIGDTLATLTEPSPLDDLMARIVGPHIRAIPDADAMAMQGAVDDALSAAMRLVLHHPEFQSVEAQWRSIDLIARSIETDDTLDVILYDVSAEEIAADLAATDDLAQSGFARLLTEEPLDEENGRGGYSALIGLYTFEETPPHAELLGRIARLAAHVDAPFFAAITPAFLDTAKDDRHPLVANAWDTLRAMPEAGHLGLVSPRFLLRRPYGAKSEPIYEFKFEEFTMAEGIKGMLWANPVVLVAILLAKSFRENGASMSLGSIMSLGDIPFHYVNDRYGDQVALPCTERNVTLDKIEMAVTRGLMSVASIKGRDEIRLTSFGSLAGGEILGPWSGTPPPPPSPPKPEPANSEPEKVDFDDGTGDDMDLDDLLADFGDDPVLGGDDDDTDAELAALLDDL
jgi:pilus assembly protein FimV